MKTPRLIKISEHIRLSKPKIDHKCYICRKDLTGPNNLIVYTNSSYRDYIWIHPKCFIEKKDHIEIITKRRKTQFNQNNYPKCSYCNKEIGIWETEIRISEAKIHLGCLSSMKLATKTALENPIKFLTIQAI